MIGINNQNFIMCDEETGTYWQQITGMAIAGPLRGRQLTLVPEDELTFGLWKAEQPQGTVLDDVINDVSSYPSPGWDLKMPDKPIVVSFSAADFKPRDFVVGVRLFGISRAFPFANLVAERVIQDNVGSEPVLVVLGPDGESVRGFSRKIDGVAEIPDFYRVLEGGFLVDSVTGSFWNFQGCAISGTMQGSCLECLGVVKDYWFAWSHYNPDTSVYQHRN